MITFRRLLFGLEGEGAQLKHGCLIVDICCGEGLGFFFAGPTSFDDPMFKMGLPADSMDKPGQPEKYDRNEKCMLLLSNPAAVL